MHNKSSNAPYGVGAVWQGDAQAVIWEHRGRAGLQPNLQESEKAF